MHHEALRCRCELLVDLVHRRLVDRGSEVGLHACSLDRRLSHATVLLVVAGLVQRRLERGPEVSERCFLFVWGEVAALHQRRCVQLADRREFVDAAVHLGQGVARIVALVVAVASVADHVDHDVFVELLAVLEGKAGDTHTRFGVVAVHVEDRSLDHLGDVGRVTRGASGRRRRR